MSVRHRRWFPLAAAATALGLLACQGAERRTERRERAIFYGTPDTAEGHQAVVALHDGFDTFCTGTLITPSVVLTAAHCFDQASVANIRVFIGDDVNTSTDGTFIQVQEALQHPGWAPNDPMSADDIALARLVSPAPATVTPIPPLPARLRLTNADQGAVLDFSGFGLTESFGSGEKLHVSVALSLVCEGPASCPFSSDSIVPRGFGYLQSSGGPCSGDSGGPAFIVRDGQEYVAGLGAYGDVNCTTWGVSTLVDAYHTWINDYLGITELCGTAGDEDGNGLADCADPACAAEPTCESVPTELCGNGMDDDGDGQVDCADPDCTDFPTCRAARNHRGGCAQVRGGTPSWPGAAVVLLLGLLLASWRRRRFRGR